MAVETIPVQQIPDQEFEITLGGQECKIRIFQRFRYCYMDLIVDDKTLFQGRICLNNVDLVKESYFNFNGELKFIDTQGENDPYYTGFNERWYLVYVQ